MPSNPGTPRLLRGINDRAALTCCSSSGAALAQPARRAHRAVQAHRVPAPRSARGSRARAQQREQPGPARARTRSCTRSTPTRPTWPGSTSRPPGSSRRSPTSPAAPSARYELSTPGERGRTPSSASWRRSTARWRRRGSSAGRLAPARRSGRPAPSTRAPSRLRYARHLPGWHDPDLLDRAAEPSASRSTSTTTSTWPRSPSCSIGAARGQRELRAAVGRGGPGRRHRHRRRSAPRRHRGRRRGRLPPAAGHPSGPRRRPQQRRRLPGARRRQAGARACPRARHRAPDHAEEPRPRPLCDARCRRRVPDTTGAPGRARSGGDRRRA